MGKCRGISTRQLRAPAAVATGIVWGRSTAAEARTSPSSPAAEMAKSAAPKTKAPKAAKPAKAAKAPKAAKAAAPKAAKPAKKELGEDVAVPVALVELMEKEKEAAVLYMPGE